MTQWLRALPSLTEKTWFRFPAPRITDVYNSNTRGVDAPFWPLWVLHVWTNRIPHIHVNKNNTYLFTSISFEDSVPKALAGARRGISSCNRSTQDHKSQINTGENLAQYFSLLTCFYFFFIPPVLTFNPFSGCDGVSLHLIYKLQLRDAGSVLAISRSGGVFIILPPCRVSTSDSTECFKNLGKFLISLMKQFQYHPVYASTHFGGAIIVYPSKQSGVRMRARRVSIPVGRMF